MYSFFPLDERPLRSGTPPLPFFFPLRNLPFPPYSELFASPEKLLFPWMSPLRTPHFSRAYPPMVKRSSYHLVPPLRLSMQHSSYGNDFPRSSPPPRYLRSVLFPFLPFPANPKDLLLRGKMPSPPPPPPHPPPPPPPDFSDVWRIYFTFQDGLIRSRLFLPGSRSFPPL